MKWTTILLWVALAAAAFHCAYISIRTSFLVVIYLFALLQLARADKWRHAYYSALVVGLIIAVGRLSFFWRIFSGGALGLWLVYAFWIGLFVAMVRICLRRLGPKPTFLLAPFIWVGLEYFRSELYYLRFSWLIAGYAFADAPWLLPLRRVGMYGVGFLLACVASFASFQWQKSRRSAIASLIVGTGLLWAWGSMDRPGESGSVRSVRVAGVQMEFPAESEVLLRLNDLLRHHPEVELVVLSEYTFDGPIPAKVKDWCRKNQRYLVVGGHDPAQSNNYYNTAFVIGPDGDIVFRQAKSVPIQFFKDGLPAQEQNLWESPWGRIGICICYDLSYTRVTDRLVQLGAEALIVPTMDVMDWGESQHKLHAYVAPIRAAEYGLPIFRLASSGISQNVAGSGHLLAQAPCPGEGAILSGTLDLRGQGALPLDRWLAPWAVGVTGLLILSLCLGLFPARPLVSSLLHLLYGFRAYNTAVLDTPGPVLLLSNHVSWWDWLLIGVCLPEDWRFVTSREAAQVSWIHKRIMINRRTFPVDMNSPYAVKHMAEYLQQGGRLVLFPEGRLTCTGSLMKLFEGTGFLILKTRPKILTAYLRGGQRLPFSRAPGRKQVFPRLSVHFSRQATPVPFEHVRATLARARVTAWLRDRLIEQQFQTEMEFGPATLTDAIVQTARKQPGMVVLQDATMQELSYRRLLAGANLLANRWRKRLGAPEQPVGVLLPNVNAMPVALLSLWTADYVPAVLNYSTGPAALLACARLSGLKHIITSRRFVEQIKLDLAPFEAAGIACLYLEEIRKEITGVERAFSLVKQFLKVQLRAAARPDNVALVLFTSGSEGEPKGVELTHRNVLANIRQMLSVVDVQATDRLFNALPLFHSFGLNIGLLLPLTRAVFVFLYLSPLHYRVVPAAFYNLNCTILFGTNTFLAGYARKAHPYDFRMLRYLFAGAEKVQEATALLWMRKFGVRILEGYGATECGPCLSVNAPMAARQGSAGRFLPGIEYRFEPIEPPSNNKPESNLVNANNHTDDSESPLAPGASGTGRLFVRGPNIMRGYANTEANAAFQASGRWYDTGDIIKVDADGYVFVLGRLKRFAKVSGEMISLSAVEDALSNAFINYGERFAVAVVARADAAKGEKLIAVTNEPRLTLEGIRAALHARGLSNLAFPREVKLVRHLPQLGSGKIDHRELERNLGAKEA